MNTALSGVKNTSRSQNTIKKAVSFSGIGIHTGAVVSLNLCPAPPGSGVAFKRIDIPDQPLIPATLDYVCDTSRSTSLGIGKIRIHTVEHVLAAVKAYSIDNLIIEISSIEPPIGNGSSDVFVEMIEAAGIEEQIASVPIIPLNQPVYWSERDIHIVAIPDEEYRISYTLNYQDSDILVCQFHSTIVNKDTFKTEIAPCRTFSQYKEIEHLMDRGLIRGGSLDNAVIIKDQAIFSKGGLFFPNEMVRHKILDMIGDLILVNVDFKAHIISIRSGHQSNFAFAKQLYKTLKMEKTHAC